LSVKYLNRCRITLEIRKVAKKHIKITRYTQNKIDNRIKSNARKLSWPILYRPNIFMQTEYVMQIFSVQVSASVTKLSENAHHAL